MPEIFINGQPVQAGNNQTVMQAAVANGFVIPYFCWHPQLSVPGNCRVCMVEVEDEKGGNWTDIACNMPVSEGLRVLTDSGTVLAKRKAMLQFLTLNHPLDCGICDKSGECTLQDHHFKYNGAPSVSHDAKVRATKFHPLSARIVLDNERCILCSRCVRFTHEISKSHALVIQARADHSVVRAVEAGASSRTRTPTTSSTSARCALLALVPLQGPRLVPEADAFDLPGLRTGLQRPLASQAQWSSRTRPAAEYEASRA
jgi:NADH-quinone oxidoreductase subunit G